MLRYQELIEQMTLEEKAVLLSGKDFWQTNEIERLEIPSMFLADGPHGIRKQMAAADHLGLNAGVPATCFPTAAATANSWDTDLGEEIGRLLGTEAAAQGVNVLLGPGLNIKRSPLCGRNFEYFSEDPYLSGKMAAAYIRGIQSKGVSACPKHFAANSQEWLRLTSDSVVDERTLREIYLTGFEIAVKEAKPKAIMTSYNKLNGAYTNEAKWLLRDLLRDEWGFDGIVVSDWGGSNDHVEGVRAGSHLEMPGTGGASDYELINAVREGTISEALLDERVDELLHVLFHTRIDPETAAEIDQEAHHQAARRAAEQSAVLLKNEDQILPLQAGTKVALIGDFADRPRYQGAGSSLVNATKLDNTLQCIAQSGLVLAGYAAGFERRNKANAVLLQEACELARQADVVLMYLGLDEQAETEGIDRISMRLADNQLETLRAVAAINPNVVVILSCGAVVELQWQKDCKGILHGYLSGQAGAGAILNILTGKVNPSGKLAETYPNSYTDTPALTYYPGKEKTAEYREGPFVGYRYYDIAGIPTAYPFGYGLSYTTFCYRDIKISETDVTFKVRNTGITAGAEVCQMYVHAKDSALFRPYKELKGFVKVFLDPGEEKEVTIKFDEMTFRFYNKLSEKFETEAGTYEILVGASSADIRLRQELYRQGVSAKGLYDSDKLKSYYSGKVEDVSDQEFEQLLGSVLPPFEWDRNEPLGINDTFSQMYYARSPVARFAYKILTWLKNRGDKKEKPNLDILFIYYAPFRNIGKMTGNIANMEMAEALLEIVNGHFFRGIGHLAGAWRRKGKRCKELEQALKEASIADGGGDS